jgi:hypothetical protein
VFKASDLLVAALENEGVDRIFGIPELSKKRNRLSSGCGPVVVAKHSSEALSALNRVMG